MPKIFAIQTQLQAVTDFLSSNEDELLCKSFREDDDLPLKPSWLGNNPQEQATFNQLLEPSHSTEEWTSDLLGLEKNLQDANGSGYDDEYVPTSSDGVRSNLHTFKSSRSFNDINGEHRPIDSSESNSAITLEHSGKKKVKVIYLKFNGDIIHSLLV